MNTRQSMMAAGFAVTLALAVGCGAPMEGEESSELSQLEQAAGLSGVHDKSGWDSSTLTFTNTGWACDGSALPIDVYISAAKYNSEGALGPAQLLAVTKADRPRGDSATLAGLCGGYGSRGFAVVTDNCSRLTFGTYRFYARAYSATGPLLYSSPKEVTHGGNCPIIR